MSATEIKPGIYSVGAMDWDRRLFDELIPLPDGINHNSYLIKDKDILKKKILKLWITWPMKSLKNIKNITFLRRVKDEVWRYIERHRN